NFRVLHDVHLGDRHLAGKLVADFLERRRDHLARSAPIRPEIDQHRRVRIEDIRLKAGIGDVLGGHSLLLFVLEKKVGTPSALATAHSPKLSCIAGKAGLWASSQSAGMAIRRGTWVDRTAA